MVESIDDEVDYLHPFGKPEMKGETIKDNEDARPSAKNIRYALQEADGHSMVKRDPFLDPEAVMSDPKAAKEPLE